MISYSKEFIINNFFDANFHSMILPNEEYNKLYQKFQTSTTENIDIFSPQEYSDLMALFNLAWFDPSYKNIYPELKKLVKNSNSFNQQIEQLSQQNNEMNIIVSRQKITIARIRKVKRCLIYAAVVLFIVSSVLSLELFLH